MELSDYLKLLIRRRWLFVAPTIIFGLLFGMYGYQQPTSYDGFASLSFIKSNQKSAANQSTDYQYDNFYSLQAGQLLTSAVHGWLADATFIAQIYQDAQVVLPSVPVTGYSRLIQTMPLPGATLMVQSNGTTPAEAEKLAASATELVKSRLDQFVRDGSIDPVTVLSSTPLHQAQAPNKLLILAAGLIVGVLIGLIGVGLAQLLWPIEL